MRRRFLLVSMFLVAVGVPARAEDTLRKELNIVADGLAKAVKALGYDSIAVGEFTGPAQLPTSGGPVIAHTLTEELHKQGITVKRVAPIGVKGEYRDVKDNKTGHLAAQIRGSVTDRSGKVLFSFNRGVFGDAMLASLFGATTSMPPLPHARDRSRHLERSLDHPSAHIAKAVVRSAASSPYGMEILVGAGSGSELEPRAVKLQDGLAFVPIRRGEIYGVRLYNDSDHEVAVTLTIDGLSMFTFSKIRDPKTGLPKNSVIILDPHSSAVIRGWHRTQEESEEFVVTEYSKSAAAELGSTAKLGTITATFALSWPTNAKPPADEPADPDSHSRQVDATGRGAQIKAQFEEVQRHFGVVRDAVSVRYTKDSAP
jgi:hypothetical protein